MYKGTCTLCLKINRRTINIINTYLQPVYEKLANLKIENDSCCMCFICHTRLRQCHQLWQLAEQTRCLLKGIQEDEIKTKFESHKSILELSPSRIINISIPSINVEIKWEPDVKKEPYQGVVSAQHEDNNDRAGYREERTERFCRLRSNAENEDSCYEDSHEDINELKVKEELEEERREYKGIERDYLQENINDYKRNGENSTELNLHPENNEPLKGIGRNQDVRNSEENSVFLQYSKVLKLEVEKISSNIISKYVCGSSTAQSTRGHPRIHESASGVNTFVGECYPNVNKQNATQLELPLVPFSHMRHKPFKCDICHCKFFVKRLLQAHIRTHAGDKSFSCDVCQHKFSLKTHLQQHVTTHTTDKPRRCDICQRIFLLKTSLQRHMKTHTGDKPFSCDICQRKFVQKASLQRHIKTHTGEKAFDCDVCQRKFSRTDSLKRHILKNHIGEKPFSCDMCERNFFYKGDLRAHIRSHSGDKPFSCDICERRFFHKLILQRHIRTHLSDKPFSCDICQRKFMRKADLEYHIRTHTGNKPFSCDICQRKFIRKSELKLHIRNHTAVKPFSCDICQCKFSHRNRLQNHARIHIRDKLQP